MSCACFDNNRAYCFSCALPFWACNKKRVLKTLDGFPTPGHIPGWWCCSSGHLMPIYRDYQEERATKNDEHSKYDATTCMLNPQHSFRMVWLLPLAFSSFWTYANWILNGAQNKKQTITKQIPKCLQSKLSPFLHVIEDAMSSSAIQRTLSTVLIFNEQWFENRPKQSQTTRSKISLTFLCALISVLPSPWIMTEARQRPHSHSVTTTINTINNKATESLRQNDNSDELSERRTSKSAAHFIWPLIFGDILKLRNAINSDILNAVLYIQLLDVGNGVLWRRNCARDRSANERSRHIAAINLSSHGNGGIRRYGKIAN